MSTATSTASSTSFAEYLTRSGQLPEDALLGHLAFFTIRTGSYPLAEVHDAFAGQGLITNLIPPADKGIDAFTKAVREMQEWSYEIHGVGQAKILLRDAESQHDSRLERVIVRELRIPGSKDPQIDIVGRLVFWKVSLHNGKTSAGSEIMQPIVRDTTTLRPDEVAQFALFENRLRTIYGNYVSRIDGNKVRQAVREYLYPHMNGVLLGRNGTYFVGRTRTDELRRLLKAVTSLTPLDPATGYRVTSACAMTLYPLVDLPEQRANIAEAFEANATEEMQGLIKELADLRDPATKTKLTGPALARIKAKYDAAMGRALEYSENLNVSMDKLGSAQETALRTWVGLVNSIGE